MPRFLPSSLAANGCGNLTRMREINPAEDRFAHRGRIRAFVSKRWALARRIVAHPSTQGTGVGAGHHSDIGGFRYRHGVIGTATVMAFSVGLTALIRARTASVTSRQETFSTALSQPPESRLNARSRR